MARHGEVALLATTLVQQGSCKSPVEAWKVAARELLAGRPDAQKKPCPKAAFLGLCEEGLVANVARGTYTTSRANKGYALKAIELLRREPTLARQGATVLWERVMAGTMKQPNSQMEVVLALWDQGAIIHR